MKTKNFQKSISLLMVASVAMSAGAQSVNVFNARECNEYLQNHPNDTISKEWKRNDTTFVRRVYISKESGRLTAYSFYTVPEERVNTKESVDPATKASLYTSAVNSQFTEKMYEDNARDTYYAKADSVPGVSANDPNAGKIVLRSKDKYGWSINLYGGYQFAENINSPVAGAGVEYCRSWWYASVAGEAGKAKYTSNAENAGKSYWSFRAEAQLGIQPFRLDSYNQNRIYFFGGFGFESYETDSRELVTENGSASFRSWGNYIYPTAGLRYEHRFFSTGNSLFLAAQWRRLQGVIQNTSSERYNALTLTVGFNFGIARHCVGMSKGEVKSLIK